jgi:hypothetical protein
MNHSLSPLWSRGPLHCPDCGHDQAEHDGEYWWYCLNCKKAICNDCSMVGAPDKCEGLQ